MVPCRGSYSDGVALNGIDWLKVDGMEKKFDEDGHVGDKLKSAWVELNRREGECDWEFSRTILLSVAWVLDGLSVATFDLLIETL